MEYEIEFYGMIAERLRVDKAVLIIDSIDGGKEIREEVIRQFPALEDLTFKCAIDNRLCEVFPQGRWHKIAVLPPFAGG